MKHTQWGERLEWGGIEWSECRPVGCQNNLVKYYKRTKLSDWLASVLGLDKYQPIMSKLSGHSSQTKRKKKKEFFCWSPPE